MRVAIVGAVIFALLLIARLSGMLLFYKIPTPANEPNLKIGDKVFTSNLKKISPNKFIVFTNAYADSINSIYMPDLKAGTIYLYRLCGVSEDIVEMRDGILWVNNKNFDEHLVLKNQYKISLKEYYSLEQENIEDIESSGQIIHFSDSVIISLDDLLIKKYESSIKPVPYVVTEPTGGCFKWLDKNSGWTTDNFGPLRIPEGYYFALGDNRHNASDSRYFGFIKKEDIKGVAINK